ncbi:MAG: class I SAM-dependent methyltransferase [Leptolyngbyaceae cyanobacterium RM1_406_9]|nr:class I SAM-dependent methyltransferase [Leptolyngbyaceae cyanobacterium RM1_406_9]
MTAPGTNNSNLALRDLIAQKIAETPERRITFADYMEWVLYHPQYGYYSTDQVKIGAKGDFVTSPHLGADFGELLAEQFAEMWQFLEHPTPFTLVEMGAGQGLMVQDVLRYLHRHHFECFEALRYVIVEKSSALVIEQQQRLAKLSQSWGNLSWQTLDEILPESVVGCCFSNELVDAFPVHQLVIEANQLQEVYVTVDQSDFTEVVGELSTSTLVSYFDWLGVDLPSDSYPNGYRTEVNLAALDWMEAIATRLQRGYLLTIDYGYPANRYYSPSRAQGTLQCYYQHAHHSNPYIHIGRQDLTAHVDFTALERQGELSGLQTVGFTQQGLFLMSLGLGDRLSALSNPTSELSLQATLQRREALHSLMNPMGLGNFGVLIQSKGLSEEERGRSLKGLKTPPL